MVILVNFHMVTRIKHQIIHQQMQLLMEMRIDYVNILNVDHVGMVKIANILILYLRKHQKIQLLHLKYVDTY
jgi:F0F1-type ATP synthase membrane subunit a